MDPTIIPGVVALVVVFGLALAVLVALAIERPDPAETAIAYEEAWDHLDFGLLWRLSSPALRGEKTREEFVAARRELYGRRTELAGLIGRVEVEKVAVAGQRARVGTRLVLREGGDFHNELRLRREGGRWIVTDYRLGPRPDRAPEGAPRRSTR